MKQHILIIDDDKDELIIFLEALKKMPFHDDFKCTYVADATQALEMLRYLTPDFIFVDLNMPQMNGLQLLANIRSNQVLSKTKAFLYSTTISGDHYKKAMALGADGCIEKPTTMSALSIKLKSILIPNLEQVNTHN